MLVVRIFRLGLCFILSETESSRLTHPQPIFLLYAGCADPAVLSTGKV